jgi:hypothetical protein
MLAKEEPDKVAAVCNECGNYIDFTANDPDVLPGMEAIRAALTSWGWRVDGEDVLCPVCKEDEPPAKKRKGKP